MTSFHFLVIGAGRGGTSLLAGLLDQHPRLEVGFEKFSVKYLMGRSLRLRAFGRRQRLLADRTGAFRRACLAESQRFPGLLWGNKITTEQLYGLENGGRIIHEVGTTRMGDDPKTSVVNKYCQAHDVKNLFIADGGPFVTNADKNVTWTILALAMRTAEYIADQRNKQSL